MTQPTEPALVPTVAYLADGTPLYVDPGVLRAHQQQAPMPHGGQQPQQVIHHHHYAAQRRGPDVQQVLGWTAVLGVVAGVLLAVAMAAVAIGLAAVAIAVLAVILRGIWRDLQNRG